MRCLLVLLLALVTVQAVFRPNYYRRNRYHDDDCPDNRPHTKKVRTTPTTTVTTTTPTTTTITTTEPTTTVTTTTPTTTTVTTTVTTTTIPTTTAAPTCPTGYTLFNRTPSAYNNNTGVWCMRLVTSSVAISVNQASALCEANGAKLTNYESNSERLTVTGWATSHLSSLGNSEGSIAIGGNRVSECVSMNRTYLEYPPCNNKTTLYELPASSHTNPAYTWTTWIEGEPNSNMWTYDVEACIQLNIKPSDTVVNGLINDIFCTFAYPPNAPDVVLYQNFGALCGVFPTSS